MNNILLSMEIKGYHETKNTKGLNLEYSATDGTSIVYHVVNESHDVLGEVSVPINSEEAIGIRENKYKYLLNEADKALMIAKAMVVDDIAVSSPGSLYRIPFRKFVADFESNAVTPQSLSLKLDNGKIRLFYKADKIGDVQSSNNIYSDLVTYFESGKAQYLDATVTSVTRNGCICQITDKAEIVKSSSATLSDEQLSILSLMKDVYQFPNGLVEAVKKYWAKRPEEYVIPRPKTLFKDGTGIVSRSITHILTGKSLIFRGEASTGKNVCAKTIHYILQVPCEDTSLSKSTTKYDLFGSPTIDATETENGIVQKVGFDLSSILTMAKKGGCAVLDEFNAAKAEELLILHSLLDFRKEVTVPKYGVLKSQPTFFVIGTMNEGYVGTSIQNPAFKSRFVIIDFEPISIAGIIKEDEFGSKLIKLFDACKEKVEDKLLSKGCLFIRLYEAAYDAYQLNSSYDLDQLIKDCITNQLVSREADIILMMWQDIK